MYILKVLPKGAKVATQSYYEKLDEAIFYFKANDRLGHDVAIFNLK